MMDRLWSKVNKDGPIPEQRPELGSCWLWTAQLHHGYGRFRVGSKMEQAHRVTYEATIGGIPAGLQLDHLCRNPACVNPSHLEPVTNRVNSLRGVGVAARFAVMTHCIHGHEFSPENTRICRNGKYTRRMCRTCDRNRYHAGKARKAAMHEGGEIALNASLVEGEDNSARRIRNAERFVAAYAERQGVAA